MPKHFSSCLRPMLWVLDWDGTITKKDTLDALVNIAAEAKPDSPVWDEWKRVTQAYLTDYESALETLVPNGELPKTVDGEKQLLELLKDVELRSLDRVSDSGIFRGLTQDHIKAGAKKAIQSGNIKIREGYKGLQTVIRRHEDGYNRKADELKILSVNWSYQFIQACFEASNNDLKHLSFGDIFANELEGLKSKEPSTGRIVGGLSNNRIVSSRDKLYHFNLIRKGFTDVNDVGTVYIGDSWTDFECLLAADLGICIRDDPMTSSQRQLAESFERLGIQCTHLREWKEDNDGNIAWAKDFIEIKEFIKNSGVKG